MKIVRVLSLPAIKEPNTVYFLKTGSVLSVIVTGETGEIVATTPSGGSQPSSSELLPVLEYESKDDIRATTPLEGDLTLIKGLGLFYWTAGISEIDDGESCFNTSVGQWLLACPDWAVVDAYGMDVLDILESDISDIKQSVLYNSEQSSIITVAGNSQATFHIGVTGALPGDTVLVTPEYSHDRQITYYAVITEPDLITVYLNNSTTTSGNLTAGMWYATVIKEL